MNIILDDQIDDRPFELAFLFCSSKDFPDVTQLPDHDSAVIPGAEVLLLLHCLPCSSNDPVQNP